MKKRMAFFKSGQLIPFNGSDAKRFLIRQQIIDGSEVYHCLDTKTTEEVILKAEVIGSRRTGGILREHQIYEKLSKYEDFDIALDFFMDTNHRFLILKKRGIDLKVFYLKETQNGGKWEDNTTNKYAVQMIAALQRCHSFGILHLDPKPNNFVLDANDDNKIYLIDFDVAKEYRSSDGNHIPFQTGLPFNQILGNRIFLSLNGHNCEEQSRRDDMIFLGYTLIWLSRADGLPWDYKNFIQTNPPKKQSNTEFWIYIKQQKTDISLEKLCVNRKNQKLDNLVQYMDYCTQLKFEEEPNYSYLISLFESKDSVEKEGSKGI